MQRYIIVLALLLLAGGIAHAKQTADIPRVISYQGLLTSSDGNPLPDGEYPVTITLYSDESGIGSVWQDTYTTAVRGGLFNIHLGTGNVPLPDPEKMDRPLWLGTRLAGAEEMRPLTRLSATPYAINVPDNAITAGKLADGAVTADKMNMDYIAGVNVNGKKIMANGMVLNIRAGKDINIYYDEATQSLVIGSPEEESDDERGSKKDIDRAPQGTQSDAWTLRGDGVDVNTGTVVVPVVGDYIGTNNNVDFNVRVNNTQIMSYQQKVAASTPNVVGGHSGNNVSANAVGNVIAGGGAAAAVNTIAGNNYNVIGGGASNGILHSNSAYGAIAGGQTNTIGTNAISVSHGTIGGGNLNTITGWYSTIGGGRLNSASGNSNTVGGGQLNSASNFYSTVAGGLGNQAQSQSSAIAGGQNNVVFGTYGAIGGGTGNQIYVVAKAATIPGGEGLIAQSYGQTVLGAFNIQKGSVVNPGTVNDEPILIVGNGLPVTPFNAFEVSYNGHSTVFHNNGPTNAARLGSTYIDNVIYAWGHVKSDGNRNCDFGVANVQRLGAGWYRVTMNTDDADGNDDVIGCGSVTATINSESDPDGAPVIMCKHIAASNIRDGVFDIYITESVFDQATQSLVCQAVDAAFDFKVTGRP